MERIVLRTNHRRSVSSAILMIEKMIIETEALMRHPPQGALHQVVNDFESKAEYEETLTIIGEIKHHISFLQDKYQLQVESSGLRWFVNVRKTKIWEILGNIRSGKLKRFGVFPAEHSTEFDNDMDKLKELSERL
jgi:hypothetical protein